MNINSALASPRYALSIEISNAENHPGFQKISSDQKSLIGEIDNFKYRSVRSFLRKTNVIFVICVVELVDSNLKNFKNLKSEFSLQIYSNPKLGYCRSAVEMFLGPEHHPWIFFPKQLGFSRFDFSLKIVDPKQIRQKIDKKSLFGSQSYFRVYRSDFDAVLTQWTIDKNEDRVT